MAEPNAMIFMCAVLRLRKRSRSPLHMKKRSCAATRAFPRLQAGAGALGAVSVPAQALAYPHCARTVRFTGKEEACFKGFIIGNKAETTEMLQFFIALL